MRKSSDVVRVMHISIPRLANGGITTGSTLANIGEAGREAVLPLENNTGWMIWHQSLQVKCQITVEQRL